MVINYETKGRIALITLNRPEARNAVNHEVAAGIEDAIDQFEEDNDLWTGILCGNGPVFSAGADLKAISAGELNLATKRGGFGGIVARERTKPLIAAVDGPALAGGTELALACDLIVASTVARFGLPEVKRSLIASAGGLVRLPRVLPKNIAMQMALTGEPISAEQAHLFGMVNVLTKEGEALDKAILLAEQINKNAPLAVRATRRSLIESLVLSDYDGMKFAIEETAALTSTEDYKEGPLAFIEKRDPIWKGK
ncbi:MAG: crotonase/enoyl-CoA hydratase family protein [Acidimicrobiales bacterium]|nr:crotonase/enoyl-CoA hydratase family protein [Acidimicrobiales bacterium]